MSMQVQEGDYVKYVFTGADLEDYFGAAVQYAADEGEVEIATEDTTKFAGVMVQVDPGKTTAEDGDNCTIVKEGIVEVIADGAIEYGDALAVGENQAFKASDADGTALTNFLTHVGRAQEDADDGDVFKALIHAQ
jgi:hypothetical protein